MSKTKIRPVWVTEDGCQFDTKELAEQHQFRCEREAELRLLCDDFFLRKDRDPDSEEHHTAICWIMDFVIDMADELIPLAEAFKKNK